MKKSWSLTMCMLMCFAPLLSCSAAKRAVTAAAHTVPEKQYTVSGRIFNVAQNPVPGCSVVLIKRTCSAETPGLPSPNIATDMPVAVSDASGDFCFTFEPLGARHVWMYIDGTDRGYAGRFVSLHDRIGHTLFERPGNNPLLVTVVLEKTLDMHQNPVAGRHPESGKEGAVLQPSEQK